MNPRYGEWVAAVCGLGLLVVMFATWYSPIGAPEVNAWEAFSSIDIVLGVVGLASLVIAVVSLSGISVSLPVAGSAVTALLAVIAMLLVAFRLIDPPGGDLHRELGAWLGFVWSAGIFAGAYIGMGEEPV